MRKRNTPLGRLLGKGLRATAVEYGLIMALVVLAVIATIKFFTDEPSSENESAQITTQNN